MKDKLCVTDRCLRMLEYLATNKFATRTELAELFNVSKDTIDRDIVYLSSYAPISTKQGNGGGIIISPNYRYYINYLKMAEQRRKNIGNKRYDITDSCREAIVQVYGDYKTKVYDFDGKVCESKIFNNEDFGFNRIQIESPLFDENGELVTKGKKNQPVPDTAKRDYENVPLIEDIDSYFAREVKPYNADAWIDKSKTKVGYEIPFTRYFYKYQAPRCSDEIADIITTQEASITASLKALFGESDK